MLDDLVLVLAIAAVVPLALASLPRLALPAPVVEILAGIVLGPGVLAVVEPDEAVRTLATIGLAFLLFLAGLEIDMEQLRGSGARLALRGLLLSVTAAAVAGAALQLTGVVDNGRLLAVLLLATSLGLVVPVLRDAGLVDRPVGQLVVAGASLGELAALVLLSLSFSERSRGPGSVVLLLVLLTAVAALVLAATMRASASARVSALVARLSDTSAQIRVRLAVLLVVGLGAVAEGLGFEAILGAFLAGVVLRRADPDGVMSHPHFREKLDGIGFGFVVPVFFVTSGLIFDVDALRASPAELLQVPIFLFALIVVRALPALAYRSVLSGRDVLCAGLLQATSLPFLVVGAALGLELEVLGPGDAAALVAAGLVSVVLFPALALRAATAPQVHGAV
ncbi:MAG: hypothetical protein AVDCRST_MAG07-2189 [uncultured Frankineae bacterium]|uniref:Cation/H+ exchanger transmembrane domain-containing protein n=1 Tax=uncultured Frankineae bacterium TaxID=437475 RepID=A0A6J4LQ94_9ACTN|nr:MAG: hypothetical protein AVDCRST_MAG07-2189 [uncultured Frankineae bacterium]